MKRKKIILKTVSCMTLTLGMSMAMANQFDDLKPTPEEILQSKGVQVTQEGLTQVLQNPSADPSLRYWAAIALGRMATTQPQPLARGRAATSAASSAVVDALVAAVNSEDSQVRYGAILALGNSRQSVAIPQIRQALADSSEQVRSAAVQALRQIGGIDAVAALGEKLGDGSESSNEIRMNAAIALGDLGDNSALPQLITALSDSSLEVRTLAAAAMAQLGNDGGIAVLIDALKSPNSSEWLNAKAVSALSKLTGQDFGYFKPYHAPTTRKEREDAKTRWIEWWDNKAPMN